MYTVVVKNKDSKHNISWYVHENQIFTVTKPRASKFNRFNVISVFNHVNRSYKQDFNVEIEEVKQ